MPEIGNLLGEYSLIIMDNHLPTSTQLRQVILGALLGSRNQWIEATSAVRHLLNEENGRWSHNVVGWSKLDINTVGCRFGSLDVKCLNKIKNPRLES